MITKEVLKNFLTSRYYLQESKSFIDKILKQHPEFKFSGTAYRAIVLGPDEKFSLQKKFFKHTSWGKTLDGVRYFLENYRREGEEVQKTVLVEAYVEGLDLTEIIRYLEEEEVSLSPEILQIHNEQEVLSTYIEELSEINPQGFYDDQLQHLCEIVKVQISELLTPQIVSPFVLGEILNLLEEMSFFICTMNLEDKDQVVKAYEYLVEPVNQYDANQIKKDLTKIGFLS